MKALSIPQWKVVLFNISFLMGSCNFPSQISILVSFKNTQLSCALTIWLTLGWERKPIQITLCSPMYCSKHFNMGPSDLRKSNLKERIRRPQKSYTHCGQRVWIEDKPVLLPCWPKVWQWVGLIAFKYLKFTS